VSMFEFLFPKSKSSLFQNIDVNVGLRTVQVPVAVIKGNRPGKTCVITGGMDGDEYTGIQAAYVLANRFASGDFCGTLIVVAIVNMPGFTAEMSPNPIDQKFPKHFFPGKERGTSTERLIHWLNATYIDGADLWIDLHSGAITEGLNPFIWLYQTGVSSVDVMTEKFLLTSGVSMAVYEKSHSVSKAIFLAERGCQYVLFESGARGNAQAVDVERHVHWVTTLMSQHEMIPEERATETKIEHLFRHVTYLYAPCDGLWNVGLIEKTIQQGQAIGELSRYDGTGQKLIVAPKSGAPLWWKETLSMRRGDILCAIAY